MVVVTAYAVLFAAGEAADMAFSGILFMVNDIVILHYDLPLPQGRSRQDRFFWSVDRIRLLVYNNSCEGQYNSFKS